MTAGTTQATRQPQVAATNVTMMPAIEAPKHQVPRLMLMTRPRNRAGQVSATSIEPSDHSPFRAKFSEGADREERDDASWSAPRTGISSENSAMLTASKRPPPVAVGEPRPDEHSRNADQQRDLHPGPPGRQIDAELLDHHRRDQAEDHAVHSVEHPAEAVGDGDVPMGGGQADGIGGVAEASPTARYRCSSGPTIASSVGDASDGLMPWVPSSRHACAGVLLSRHSAMTWKSRATLGCEPGRLPGIRRHGRGHAREAFSPDARWIGDTWGASGWPRRRGAPPRSCCFA